MFFVRISFQGYIETITTLACLRWKFVFFRTYKTYYWSRFDILRVLKQTVRHFEEDLVPVPLYSFLICVYDVSCAVPIAYEYETSAARQDPHNIVIITQALLSIVRVAATRNLPTTKTRFISYKSHARHGRIHYVI